MSGSFHKTLQKMHHPVCEIWLARKIGSSQPRTILHHLILILTWPPLTAASKNPLRFVMQSSTNCFLLLSTGRLVFVYKAKKTSRFQCLKVSQNTLGHIHRIVHGVRRSNFVTLRASAFRLAECNFSGMVLDGKTKCHLWLMTMTIYNCRAWYDF